MATRTNEDRKQALLNQLENPSLTTMEIEKIEKKIAVLDKHDDE